MRYDTVDGKTYIYMEDGEDILIVLRAIARASYEMAQPVGAGFMHYVPGGTLSNEDGMGARRSLGTEYNL